MINNTSNINDTRPGFSLIEMMVVMAVAALLLGVAMSLMFSLRQWDRQTRESAARTDQRFRLAETLRADIRAAGDVLLSIDGPLVVMTPGGEQIRYTLNRTGCTRTIGEPGDSLLSRDEFGIGGAGRWQVDRIAEGHRPLVAVTLEAPSSGKAATSNLPLIVYAALGADAVTDDAAD